MKYTHACFAFQKPSADSMGRWLLAPVDKTELAIEQANGKIVYRSIQLFPLPDGLDYDLIYSWRGDDNISSYYSGKNALPHAVDFALDIDSPNNIEEARTLACYAIDHLVREAGLEEKHIGVWFSGSKGFHIIVDHRIMAMAPSVQASAQLKLAVNELFTYLHSVGAPGLNPDKSLYSMPHLLRLAGQRHAGSNLYKIELTHDQLRGAAIEEIFELAKNPQNTVIPQQGEVKPVESAANWWKSLHEYSCRKNKSIFNRGSVQGKLRPDGFVTDQLIDKTNMPDCIQLLYKIQVPEGKRNPAELQIACWAKAAGKNIADAQSLLCSWIKANRPEMAEDHVLSRSRGIVKPVFSSDNYGFSCAAVRSVLNQIDQKAECKDCRCVKPTIRRQLDSIRVGTRAEWCEPQCVDLARARFELQQVAEKVVIPGERHIVLANADDKGIPLPYPGWLLRHPAGTGKSSAIANALAKQGERAVFFAPTHELTAQMQHDLKRLNVTTHRWREGPLPEDGCTHLDEVEFFREHGFSISFGPCRECERRSVCPYRAQFSDPSGTSAQVLLCSSWHLRRDDFWNHDALQDRTIAVIDEDSLPHLCIQISISLNDLTEFINGLDKMEQYCDESIAIQKENSVPTTQHEKGLELLEILRQFSRKLYMLPIEQADGGWHYGDKITEYLSKDDKDIIRDYGAVSVLASTAYTMASQREEIPNLIPSLRSLILHPRPVLANARGLQWLSHGMIPGERKTIFLDATAEPEIVGGIFKVFLHDVPSPRINQKAKIIQIMDHIMPRSKMKHESDWLRKLISSIVSKHSGEKVFLATFKTEQENLDDLLAEKGINFLSGHFGALRGRNDFQDCTVGIIIGRPMPNPAALELWAMGAFGESAFGKDLSTPPLNFTIDEVEIGPEIWRIKRQRYDDPRWNKIWQHTVTAELTQAIGRLRPLSNNATIYVVTNEPISSSFKVKAALAEEIFPEMSGNNRRTDFAAGLELYKEKVLELVSEGIRPTNKLLAETMGVSRRTITAYRTEARKDPIWCKKAGIPSNSAAE